MALGGNFSYADVAGHQVIFYPAASSHEVAGLEADLFLPEDRYYYHLDGYDHPHRSTQATYSGFAGETLDYLVRISLMKGDQQIPPEFRAALLGSVALFDAHGNTYDGLGWGVRITEDDVVPVQQVADSLAGKGYSTVMITTCNPDNHDIIPRVGALIYPHGVLGLDPNEFSMVLR